MNTPAKVILFNPASVPIKPMAEPMPVHPESDDEKCYPCIHLRQVADSKQSEALDCLRTEIRMLKTLIAKAEHLAESTRLGGRNTDGAFSPRHIDAADSSVTKIPHGSVHQI